MITKIVPAIDESMQTVFDFIHEQIPENCPEDMLNKIDLAVEEIFINIAHYAYAPDKGNATISCGFEDETLTVVFSDSGKQFNPLLRDDPDISLSLDEREIGGLGIFMTKKLTDKIEYEYKDGKNILITEKNFE